MEPSISEPRKVCTKHLPLLPLYPVLVSKTSAHFTF